MNEQEKKEYQKKYHLTHKEKWKTYYQAHKEEWREYGKKYYQTHKEKWSTPEYKRKFMEQRRLRIQQLRKQCIFLLGSKCSNLNCLVPGGCLDTRCLHIDHKLSNGSRERRKWGNQYKFYNRVLEHLDEYQILCANCNWIKRVELKEDGRKS